MGGAASRCLGLQLPAAPKPESGDRQEGVTSGRDAGGTPEDRLKAARQALDDARAKIRGVLAEEVDRAVKMGGSDEQLRLRVAELELFDKTGFVPAGSPKADSLRKRQQSAFDAFRTSLATLSKQFPDHQDEVRDELVNLNARRRVDLTGTWTVKYPQYVVSRPYAFADDGEKVLVSSEGHPATGLIRASGEWKWDKDHMGCIGEIEEEFADNPHKWRSTIRAEVLDPNTLEVVDVVVNYDTGQKKRVVLHYHRQE